MRSPARRLSDARPTGVVLWLMILVVFVPLAGLHGLARLFDDAPRSGTARHAATATPVAR